MNPCPVPIQPRRLPMNSVLSITAKDFVHELYDCPVTNELAIKR